MKNKNGSTGARRLALFLAIALSAAIVLACSGSQTDKPAPASAAAQTAPATPPPAAAAPADALKTERANQALVEGTLTKLSKLPDAPKSPYPNCLYTATLEIRQILAGSPIPKKVVLVLPGFTNRIYAMEAGYKLGDKIRAVVAPFDSMPETVKQIQQADYVDEFYLEYFYAEKSRPIADYAGAPGSVQARESASAAAEKNVAAEVDEAARTARRETIQKDLAQINELLAKHGGSWDTWFKSLQKCQDQYAQQMKAKAAKWVGKSYFTAGRVDYGPLYIPEFVKAMVVFKNYLAKRNVDLILLRVPNKGEICGDLFAPMAPDGVYNPYLLRFYKELLDADVEIATGIIPHAEADRLKYPLMYWYQDYAETHPAEGIAWVIAEEFAQRLSRYKRFAQAPKTKFKQAEGTGPTKWFLAYHWPPGNPAFDPADWVRYAVVQSPEGKPMELGQGMDSPLLVIGSSFIGYPSMPQGGSVPHYLAYLTGIAPDVLYRSGSDASIPRSVAQKGDKFLKNRCAVLYPFPAGSTYNVPSLPPLVNPTDAPKTLLAAYTGESLKNQVRFAPETAADVFSYSVKGYLVIKPANKTFGAAGRVQFDLPPQISRYEKFILEIDFGSQDHTRMTAQYGGQSDISIRSNSEMNINNYFVFTPENSLAFDLDFSDGVSNDYPTSIKGINIYGTPPLEPTPGPTPTPSPKPSPTPTPSPTKAPAGPAQGGAIASQPVTADDLKRLGYEPYGTAIPAKMRRYAVGTVEEIEFWYPETDPQPKETAGLKKTFPTTPGQSYRLSVEIYDGYQNVIYPNHIAQKVTVGGETIDTHDISVPAFFGWRTVEKTFTAKGPATAVCAFLEVAGPLEHFNWGYACKSIVRNITLDPAP